VTDKSSFNFNQIIIIARFLFDDRLMTTVAIILRGEAELVLER
jgi:hypothetical protein